MEFTQRARRLWRLAMATGVAGAALALAWVNSSGGPGLDWIWGITAFGVGVIAYNVTFFTLCSAFLPGLSDLVEDDTEVKGDDVTHVVRHAETGDEKIDFYIRAYAAARGISATTIVAAIMMTVVLWLF